MESLKQHLLHQCNEAEDERKALLAKQMDMSKMLSAQQAEAAEREQLVNWLTARVRHLETCINEGDSKLHSELSKLIKENEKLRLDKESTEGTAMTAQDQLAQAQRDNHQLREQVAQLHDDIRLARQKSKEEVADLEYKVEQLLAKKQSLIVETTTLHASVAELESACRRHLEDKREMRSAAADQQVKLADALARRDELERIIAEERTKWETQQEEWQQFQKVLNLILIIFNLISIINVFKFIRTCWRQSEWPTILNWKRWRRWRRWWKRTDYCGRNRIHLRLLLLWRRLALNPESFCDHCLPSIRALQACRRIWPTWNLEPLPPESTRALLSGLLKTWKCLRVSFVRNRRRRKWQMDLLLPYRSRPLCHHRWRQCVHALNQSDRLSCIELRAKRSSSAHLSALRNIDLPWANPITRATKYQLRLLRHQEYNRRVHLPRLLHHPWAA